MVNLCSIGMAWRSARRHEKRLNNVQAAQDGGWDADYFQDILGRSVSYRTRLGLHGPTLTIWAWWPSLVRAARLNSKCCYISSISAFFYHSNAGGIVYCTLAEWVPCSQTLGVTRWPSAERKCKRSTCKTFLTQKPSKTRALLKLSLHDSVARFIGSERGSVSSGAC